MAQVVVRKLEDEVKERLRQRAARHGRSMEEEIRDILRDAVKDADADADADAGSAEPGLGTRIVRRFSGSGLTFDIPEIRGQAFRPATFDE